MTPTGIATGPRLRRSSRAGFSVAHPTLTMAGVLTLCHCPETAIVVSRCGTEAISRGIGGGRRNDRQKSRCHQHRTANRDDKPGFIRFDHVHSHLIPRPQRTLLDSSSSTYASARCSFPMSWQNARLQPTWFPSQAQSHLHLNYKLVLFGARSWTQCWSPESVVEEFAARLKTYWCHAIKVTGMRGSGRPRRCAGHSIEYHASAKGTQTESRS